MNFTQNDRIKQVTADTLIVGENFLFKFHRPLMRWNLISHS